MSTKKPINTFKEKKTFLSKRDNLLKKRKIIVECGLATDFIFVLQI